MSFHHDPAADRDRAARRRVDRDSWTDIAYLIVAVAALLLTARLWSRTIQPWTAGVLAQLTWPDVVLWAVVLVLALVVAARWRISRRRRRAAGCLRVVDLPRHTGAGRTLRLGSATRTGKEILTGA